MCDGGVLMRSLSGGLMVLLVACGSSSGPPPIDPLATAYCMECSDTPNCERLITETLTAVCPDETSAWYTCVTDNACDETACETEWATRNLCMGRAPRDKVRVSIFSSSPSANIGHRGTGPTREGHLFPENSIPSFLAAMDEGADGIELDVEITQDGKLIVMHDDTVNRTTDCIGCVSQMTFEQVRACRLLDGAGNPTEEQPPTLPEIYSAIGGNALINVELKVFGEACMTDTTGPEQLVPLALDEVTRLGGEDRTIFSSFDETALELVKAERPGYYSAFLSLTTGPAEVEKALLLNQDAIHPFVAVSADTVQGALDEGLQVNVWTLNTAGLTDEELADLMQEQIDKGATGIINDEPAILADLLAP
jgi:glycerophosphoryl diester phosphodiesterase